jgi:hypothetical protein
MASTPRAVVSAWAFALLVSIGATTGCAGYADHTRDARAALDAGRTQDALALFNKRLDVDTEKQLPDDISGDKILYVLERSVVLQALNESDWSSRDLEVADKQIQVLDFTRGTLDDISKYMFSDSAGSYQAPPYEKLMINTLNMVNYLTRGDLNGARVEARRLAVMQQFIGEHESPGAVVGVPGSYLAGFTFEKSHEPGEALRFYDEAMAHGSSYATLVDPVRRLSKLDGYRGEHIKELLSNAPHSEREADADADSAELLVVVGYGRVPAKKALRLPIGLALTMASSDLSPNSRSQANGLAAQGLVTWINLPTMPKPTRQYSAPLFIVDQRQVPLEAMLAVDAEAVNAWNAHKGKMIASAITRLVTRVVAGEVARKATGGGLVGLLASLGTQVTLTATDIPDTRSWSTLPARIAVGRVRVRPGQHTIELTADGEIKQQTITLTKGGWAVLDLTVLR